MMRVLVVAGGPDRESRGVRTARRSARISSQCNSDGNDSGEEQRRSQRSKTWLKRKAEADGPKTKKSRLGKASQVPLSPAARQRKIERLKAMAPALNARGAAKPKPKPSPPQTQARQLKSPQVRHDPKDSKAGAITGAHVARALIMAPQEESSEWSSEAEGAEQPLEHDHGAAQSSKAPEDASPAAAAKAETAHRPSSAARPAGKIPASTSGAAKAGTVHPPSSATRPAGKASASSPQHPPNDQAAGKHATPLPQSAAKAENAKAAIPPQAPAGSTMPASVKPESSPIKSRVPYSPADVGALLAAFEQNRCSQAASQSPAKKLKREDKGKGKVSEMPRDPGQPGPSNAVYCTPAEEVVFSDDDSLDLNTGLM